MITAEKTQPVQRILEEHLDTSRLFPLEKGRLIFDVAYMLDLIRAAPTGFYYDSRFREVLKAIDTLIKLLPHQVAEAERLGRAEVAAGRSTALWAEGNAPAMATLLQTVQQAVEPFRGMNPSKRQDGEWHRYVFLLHMTLAARSGLPPLSFDKRDGGTGGRVISALLELAGIEKSPETIAQTFLRGQTI